MLRYTGFLFENLGGFMKNEELTFGTRCIYAFMGFVSAGVLSVLIVFSVGFLFRRMPLSFGLIGAGVFTLVFTVWGFISGEKMIEELAHFWDKYSDH